MVPWLIVMTTCISIAEGAYSLLQISILVTSWYHFCSKKPCCLCTQNRVTEFILWSDVRSCKLVLVFKICVSFSHKNVFPLCRVLKKTQLGVPFKKFNSNWIQICPCSLKLHSLSVHETVELHKHAYWNMISCILRMRGVLTRNIMASYVISENMWNKKLNFSIWFFHLYTYYLKI